MRRRSRKQHDELLDDARLLREWRAWHREQRDEALAGPRGDVVAPIMMQLGQLETNSAAMLLADVKCVDWNAVAFDVRLTILHEINFASMRVRERAGLPPLNDPPPSEPDNVFQRVKQMLFAPPPGASPV
jgi:2-keto-4-pentenoate hydratase